ncbi:MAG TPA: toll/interleukin-1 receptor domain-containing protein [Actinomycetota bacterium]
MTDAGEGRAAPETDTLAEGPLVFISHDSRDAELAEAFSKLLKSVSAGMIKTFRSSDKKAGGGIDFGEEWYKRLMTQLQSTSDVVCLFTERSLDRPWILFEAGVAKGKLDTPVVGVALGVPLSRVSAGPFYQFQNMDDGEEDLTKLVHQLARRVSGLELDADVVRAQVQAFKETEASIVKALGPSGGKKTTSGGAEESSVAKLIEEMKTLPSRVAERLADEGDPFRRRRMRRLDPMMFEELMYMSGEPGDPVAILMAASIVRDDLPWLYELAMEVYRAVKSGNIEGIEREIKRIRRLSEMVMRGPFMEEFGFGRKEHHMIAMEFPRMLEHTLRRTLEMKKPRPKRKPKANQVDHESIEL